MELTTKELINFLRGRAGNLILSQYERYMLSECADRLEKMQVESTQYSNMVYSISKQLKNFDKMIKQNQVL